MTNLLEKVEALRELARDFARLYAINRWLWDKATLTARLNAADDTFNSVSKYLSVAEYDLDHLDPTHPTYTEDKEKYEKVIIESKEEIIGLKKEATELKESLTKSITELDQKITDLQSGKIKITREHIDEQFDRLVSRMDELN